MAKKLLAGAMLLGMLSLYQPVSAGGTVDVVGQILDPIGEVMGQVTDVVTSVVNVVVSVVEISVVAITSPITVSLCMAGVDFGCQIRDSITEDVQCRVENGADSPPFLPACANKKNRTNTNKDKISITITTPDGETTNSDTLPPIPKPNILPKVVVIPLQNWTSNSNSNELSGGGGGGGGAPPCTSVSLGNIDFQGSDYTVLRAEAGQDFVSVADFPGSQTSFIDTGLKSRTHYEYKFRVNLPSGLTDTGAISAYTKCLPQCGFGVKDRSVPKYGKGTLLWQCSHNDVAKDSGVCAIQNLRTGQSTKVDAVNGILEVKADTSTNYALSCTNIDGTVNLQQRLDVFTAGIIETNPR